MTPAPHALYVHIPFCTTKCTYCAFNTYTHLESLIPAFVDALVRELEMVASAQPMTPLATVFFGGGTPSLLSIDQHARLLNTIRTWFDLAGDAEISIETNPNDLDLPYLVGLRREGYNRLSIGMQSANERELRLFARRHDHTVVTRIWPLIRQAGFDNVNLDLIYGSPYQTLDSWRHTLDETLRFAPEHVSLYALGLEDGTPLKDWVDTGSVPRPDDDLAADMYDLATEMLDHAGYQQYEISNWCRPGYECRHNLQYWRNLPYIGVGPGAHGYAGGLRYATELSPQRYVRLLQETVTAQFPLTPAITESTAVDQQDEIADTLMMGLRLTREGISLDTFAARFGVSLLDLHGDVITKHVSAGLLHVNETRVVLTERGRFLSNVVLRDLI
ncbi:MAG: radical SAM family heme chaperone HemW [Chloroflexi bacterium]|nr:radical SAM family heme chaperone HemW [Chloroflexota bacterium]